MPSPYFNDDTIAAILTAPNALSALGVVRVSGLGAWAAAEPLLRSVSGETFSPEKVDSHKLLRARVVSGVGETLDDAMFVWMKAPHSFTGEDVVELHLHGNPLLLRRVMQELLKRNVREALPGEFSFRAFRNGKLSLDQAESVADLIASRNSESARRALDHLLGGPRKDVADLKAALVDRLAEVEIDIDFSDQGLSNFAHEEWAGKLDRWVGRVERMRTEYLSSQPLREGIRLALVGHPNSGKSSLFNRMLGEDRSIVSSEAGTTRDVVRESIEFGGLMFEVADTAGIRDTRNEIEAQGIERSFGEASSAHLVIWVFDGEIFESSTLSRDWKELEARLGRETKIVAVWNKLDLAPTVSKTWLEFFRERSIPSLGMSAKRGEGLPELIAAITGLFRKTADQSPDFWISRTRHFEVLGKAADSVKRAISRVRSGERFPDLLASDLRSALDQVGEITGEVSSDDLLNHIFSEFCIGK